MLPHQGILCRACAWRQPVAPPTSLAVITLVAAALAAHSGGQSVAATPTAAATPALSFSFTAPHPSGGGAGVSAADLWSAQPLTDHNLRSSRAIGQFLMPNNSALSEALGWEWPYALTLPLTTQLTTVRLLGGWGPAMAAPNATADWDIVYRASNGTLVYRWPLLWDRLDAFVNNGVTPTVVLDNVPYCFVSVPSQGTYGQTKGPDDPAEYGEFVRAVVQQIADRYGVSRASTFRWRVGTEADNPNGHWNDTAQKYMETYDYVETSVRAVLPAAPVGPSNWCPFAWETAGCRQYGGFAQAVVKHLASGRNYANASRTGSSVAWFSSSFYGGCHAAPDRSDNRYSGYAPRLAALESAAIAAQRASSPRFASAALELQEYGTLANCARQVSNEPGSYGAAWVLQTSAEAVANGVSRIFHWNDMSTVPLNKTESGTVYLANANLWLMAVANGMQGGAASALTPVSPSAPPAWQPGDGPKETANAVVDVCPRVEDATLGNVTACGLGVWMPARGSLPDEPEDERDLQAAPGKFVALGAVLATNKIAEGNASISVTFQCPASWGEECASVSSPALRATQLRLDSTTSPIDIINADLRAVGGLKFPDDNVDVYAFPQGANQTGVEYVQDQERGSHKYSKLQDASLRPMPFDGSLVCAQSAAPGAPASCTLTWQSMLHATRVVYVEPSSGTQSLYA